MRNADDPKLANFSMINKNQKKFHQEFFIELKNFIYFIKNPFIPAKIYRDHLSLSLYFKHLLSWILFLWFLNFFILGPITASIAREYEITHKLDILNIPWLTAIFWAPIVEEMVFRYGFIRPSEAILLAPLFVSVLLIGPKAWTILVLVLAISALIFLFFLKNKDKNKFVNYVSKKTNRHFPWIFHSMTILFASIHLCNFSLNKVAYWIFPILVLPQWITGLVLGWVRVHYGISSSILLHSLFNLGPILLIWIFIKLPKIIPISIIQ